MKDGKADVSVILRSCGRPAWLARTLASIEAQTSVPLEVVVVAIGAPGQAALDAVRTSLPLKVVPTSEGRERGAALNDGVGAATEEWVAILDDDDTWEPDFLEKMMAAGARGRMDGRFGAVVCQTEAVYERAVDGAPRECGREPFNPGLAQVTARDLFLANRFTINAVLWHRRVFAKLGGFSETLPVLEDWEFNLRAAVEVFELTVLPQMLARYHQRPPSDRTPNTAAGLHDEEARRLQRAWLASGMMKVHGATWRLRLAAWWGAMMRRKSRLGARMGWRQR